MKRMMEDESEGNFDIKSLISGVVKDYAGARPVLACPHTPASKRFRPLG